jgi:hypothetical protein
VTVIHREPLVPFGVQAMLAYSTFAVLLMIKLSVLILGYPEDALPLLNDPARFASRVRADTPSPVLLIELGIGFESFTCSAFKGSPVSSLCTFARVALSRLRIALV